jgi:replicative DNA helicase
MSEEVDDIRELQATAISDLTAITADEHHATSGAELGAAFLAHIEKARIEGEPNRIRYGFHRLDAYTGGMGGGELIIVAARPGTGKTAIGLQITINNIKAGKRVLIFNLEMTARQLMQRIASNLCLIRGEKFRLPKLLKDEDIHRLSPFHEVFNDKLHVITTARSVESIRLETLKHKLAGTPPDLIIVDYLSLLEVSGKNDNRAVEVGKISRSLKLLAMEMEVPVITMAQLNREGERAGRRPKMIDLRESGSIEQDADVILLLHNQNAAEYQEEQADAVDIDLIVAKNRHGTGDLQMPFTYIKPTQRFEQKFKN